MSTSRAAVQAAFHKHVRQIKWAGADHQQFPFAVTRHARPCAGRPAYKGMAVPCEARCRDKPGHDGWVCRSTQGVRRLEHFPLELTGRDAPATPLAPPLPACARLSGEKLGIAELHLVWAFALFAVAGVDRCRFADLGNRASREQELADELSETDWQHGDAVDPRRDAQQQIGDHRREDLQPNGVLVVAEELADREMLLDPAEQQFDLLSALVER